MSPQRHPTIFAGSHPSPLGRIWFASDDVGVVCLQMPSPAAEALLLEQISRRYGYANIEDRGEINARFLTELEGYFSGSLRDFSTPANPSGTPFQQRVWRLVSRIPYGKTRSYGDVASELGIPKGPRAVGQANARNPVPLLIPCHRVIASGGGLGGYSAGIEKKRFLLEWERGSRAGPS
jgi:methylated-DNA-[protein]-cysteine S-methyltransferase